MAFHNHAQESLTAVSLAVNGSTYELKIEPRTLLVHLLRDHLDLTGTKIGCDTSQCGVCTVLLEGKAVKSCTVLALQCEAAQVITIEGFAAAGKLHPLQQAFQQHHGLQCGFCTPGMILAAADLLGREKAPDENAVRRAISGNLCRCTGYQSIIESVRAASAMMSDE